MDLVFAVGRTFGQTRAIGTRSKDTTRRIPPVFHSALRQTRPTATVLSLRHRVLRQPPSSYQTRLAASHNLNGIAPALAHLLSQL